MSGIVVGFVIMTVLTVALLVFNIYEERTYEAKIKILEGEARSDNVTISELEKDCEEYIKEADEVEEQRDVWKRDALTSQNSLVETQHNLVEMERKLIELADLNKTYNTSLDSALRNGAISEKQIKALEEDVTKYKSLFLTTHKAKDKIEGDYNTIKQAYDSYEAIVNSISKAKDEIERDYNTIKQAYDSYEAIISSSSKILEERNERIIELAKYNEILTKEMEVLKSAFEESGNSKVQSEQQSEMNISLIRENKILRVSFERSEAFRATENLKNKAIIEDWKAAWSEIDLERKKAFVEIGDLQRENISLKQEKDSLAQAVNSFQKDCVSNEGLHSEIKYLRTYCDKANNETSKLKVVLSDKEQEYNIVRASLTATEQKVESLKALLGDLDSKNKNQYETILSMQPLSADNERLREERNRLKDQLNNKNCSIKDLEQDNEVLRGSNVFILEHNAKLLIQVETLKSEVEANKESNVEVSNLIKDYNELRDSFDVLQKNYVSLVASNNKLEQDVKSLNTVRDILDKDWDTSYVHLEKLLFETGAELLWFKDFFRGPVLEAVMKGWEQRFDKEHYQARFKESFINHTDPVGLIK